MENYTGKVHRQYGKWVRIYDILKIKQIIKINIHKKEEN